MKEEDEVKIKELTKKVKELEYEKTRLKEEIQEILESSVEELLNLKEGHYYRVSNLGSCNRQYFKWTKNCRLEDKTYISQDFRTLLVYGLISVFCTRTEYNISFSQKGPVQVKITEEELVGFTNSTITEIEKEEYDKVLNDLKKEVSEL